VVCSIISVILEYMLLVTFMWMLMEGVVLYVALVKVFIYNHKYYIIGFTIVSYGTYIFKLHPSITMNIVIYSYSGTSCVYVDNRTNRIPEWYTRTHPLFILWGWPVDCVSNISTHTYTVHACPCAPGYQKLGGPVPPCPPFPSPMICEPITYTMVNSL